MYPIDEFKYAVLLSALEKIKGSKGPIDKFIKRVFSETDELSIRDNESVRYAFMLITRAIAYSEAVNKCNIKIKRRLDTVSDHLITNVITPENVLQTFEFWEQSLSFRPLDLNSLKRTHDILLVLQEAKKSSYNVYYWNILEVRHLENHKRDFVLRMFIIGAISKDSPLLITLSPVYTNFDPILLIASIEQTVNNLQIILKETHEYVSHSSTTDE